MTAVSRSWRATAVTAVVLTIVCAATFLTFQALAQQPGTRTDTRYSPPPDNYQSATVPPTVVFIGDSYTGGSDMGGRGRQNWTRVAADDLGWRPCTFAIGGSGWTRGTNDWTFGSRIDWALARNPSAIVFANAVNDLKSPQRVEAEADAALGRLRSMRPEIVVIVIGPAKLNPGQVDLVQMDDALARVSATYGAIYISPTVEDWFDEGNSSYLGGDRFHPTDEGNTYYASRFIAHVREAGIVLPDVDRDEASSCPIPDWGRHRPDGTAVVPSLTPSPTP